MVPVLAIFGVPRSGTSWLGQLFNSSPHVAYRYQPLFSHAFKERIGKTSAAFEIERFHRELLVTDDPFVTQSTNLSGNPTPDFFKSDITQLVWKEVRYLGILGNLLERTATKVIGLIRHPAAVIHSWAGAPREFDCSWDLLEEWRYANEKNGGRCEEFFGYERWKTAARMLLAYQDSYPEQFRMVVYEALNEAPEECLRSMFRFIGISYGEQTVEFVRASTNTDCADPYDVYRRSRTGYEWATKLDPRIISAIHNDDEFVRIRNELGHVWNIRKAGAILDG